MIMITVQVLRAQLDLAAVRQEIERRLAEKEEEYQVKELCGFFGVYFSDFLCARKHDFP